MDGGHTGMVPVDMAKLSVQLWRGLNQTWCGDLMTMYNNNTTTAEESSSTTQLTTFTAVLMLLLGSFLLTSSLLRLFFGRQVLNVGLGGYNLYPTLRMMLRVTFVLFTPLLSSVLAHTKQDQQGGQSGRRSTTEILLVLFWLLLVELIRKKVQAMDLPTDGSSFRRGIGRFTIMDYATEVGHLTWTGYLVYSNINKEPAILKAIFIILWLIGFAKLAQRGFNTWKASDSWHTARNPLLIAGYMEYVVQQDQYSKEQELHHHSRSTGTATAACTSASDDDVRGIMKMCQFVVAKEHRLVPKKDCIRKGVKGPIGDNNEKRDVVHNTNLAKIKGHKQPASSKEKAGTLYRVGGPHDQKNIGVYMDLSKTSRLVTVGKVWGLHGDPLFTSSKVWGKGRRTYLEDLCLSFSLFKLMRRQFEQYPMVEVGTSMARTLMLKGLLNLHKDDDGPGNDDNRTFRVLQQELDFLEAYYQAGDPVVMSNPLLFFLNFTWSMLLVPIYIFAILVTLITNDDAAYLYCTTTTTGWSSGLLKFPFLYVAITFALLATVISIESSEFFASYLLSNWNTVRMVCSYIDLLPSRRRLHRNLFYYFVSFRFLVHRVLRSLVKKVFRRPVDNININQVSIVESCFPFHLLYKHTRQGTLGPKAKERIIQSMNKLINMETGHVSLQLPSFAPVTMFTDESTTSTRRTKSTTEIILMFHLTTELYEIKHKEDRATIDGTNRALATRLSRYCMYLVERMPALLPDDETWVSERAGEMRSCLARVLQQCRSGYMLCTPSRCCKHMMPDSLLKEGENLEDQGTLEAVKMLDKIQGWDELASFWVNLLIYLAPSDNIQAHAKAVASNGDLMSCLWAFCTHAGITRLPLGSDDARV